MKILNTINKAKNQLSYIPLLNKLNRTKRNIPIYIFCYHKVGTVLLSRIFREICMKNGWKYTSIYGKPQKIPKNADVILIYHSLINPCSIENDFAGIHLIRDPRDVIVSGYLYHCRTQEAWCINKNFSTKTPIRFPRVPYSREHLPEKWKINYMNSLKNMSYQENLLSRSRYDGLIFEMDNYGAWTIESMLQWNYGTDNILELKFEDLMNNFDFMFSKIFNHAKFTDNQLDSALQIAANHDLGRKTENEIKTMDHVFSKKTSKWKEYFEEEHKKYFLSKFGDILITLGYESSNDW